MSYSGPDPLPLQLLSLCPLSLSHFFSRRREKALGCEESPKLTSCAHPFVISSYHNYLYSLTILYAFRIMRILGLPSALCAKSVSQSLLRYGNQALQNSLLRPKPFMEIANIGMLPLFDGHRYMSEATFPPEVRKYRDQLENSKAVMFSTHEHEHGFAMEFIF